MLGDDDGPPDAFGDPIITSNNIKLSKLNPLLKNSKLNLLNFPGLVSYRLVKD